ncbi:NAD(P)-dependent dehydrogenase (short-subunit alcohol dehydrogenase family) [Sphingomonas vulcanisoli]|uniref:NAD(P)-dependent dehydrogenase (Short-subunit alcohol dehydrogenase family) n=1 Tax=Sphingomonas vulcanisoli TaxID=1658060 RepID=A0ABX0U084_9SPHN|nr:SDR family oxidoreductase [Sphingomonas vulcanisoli]NIJ09281.1 NAD(P)-dependent dehydrogenase (short-subunit alcohol dehydrogenase family) [Sphingomonas vulcanisoli]
MAQHSPHREEAGLRPLEAKVIIVTGALGGIGGAAARELVAAGVHVVATDITPAGDEALAQWGADASFFRADLTQEDQVAALVAHTLERHGRLDGAFNNAGIEQHGKPLTQLDAAEWDRVLHINLGSMFFCLKHQIPAMASGGSIVLTSSILGQVAVPNAAEYIASKHAVIGLMRAAAIEGGPLGIRVNAVLPGAVDTPLLRRQFDDPALLPMMEAVRKAHPLGRFALPEEIAKAVKWLLSGESSFTTGATISIDGGFTAT